MSAEQTAMLDSLAAAEPTEVVNDSQPPVSEPVNEKPDVAEVPADGGGADKGEKVVVDADTGDTKEKLVPLAELRKSREEAKELKRQIDELNAQPKLTAEDAQLLKELKAQRDAPKEEKEPEFMDDPKGYVDIKLSKALKVLDEANKKVEAIQTNQNRQQQLQALVGAVQAHEVAFSKETPDYPEALTHLRTVRSSQLKMLYPMATDQQITQAIMQEELQTANNIIRNGGNPAKFAYDYAKTIGYAKKEAPRVDETEKPTVSKDAGRSLGGNAAAEKDASETDTPMPEFQAALAERFKQRAKR